MVTLIKTLLELDGYRVLNEARAAEVLVTIKRERPDIVLMDVHLGDADGLEILQTIRADAEVGSVPVVIASGEDVGYRGEQAGASAFLLKPYTPDQLTALIRRILN